MARISVDEFLTPDYPAGSELVNGIVHLNDVSSGTSVSPARSSSR